MRLLEQYHFKISKLTKLSYNGFNFPQFPSITDMFPLFIILLSSSHEMPPTAQEGMSFVTRQLLLQILKLKSCEILFFFNLC